MFCAGSLKYCAAEILAGEQTAWLGTDWVQYSVVALQDLIWRRGERKQSLNAPKEGTCPRQCLLLKTTMHADHSIQHRLLVQS